MPAKRSRSLVDGPASPLAQALALRGPWKLSKLKGSGLSEAMVQLGTKALSGNCVFLGLPFRIQGVHVVTAEAIQIPLPKLKTRYLALLQTADRYYPSKPPESPRGEGGLNLPLADAIFTYADGQTRRLTLRRRHHMGDYQPRWGEAGLQCVPQMKPRTLGLDPEPGKPFYWGQAQTRVTWSDWPAWMHWIHCWKNPRPSKALISLRLEPHPGCAMVLSALSAVQTRELPLRWGMRRKLILTTQPKDPFPQIDLGQVISLDPRPDHPGQSILEFTAHPEASLHFGRRVVSLSKLRQAEGIKEIPPARLTVELLVTEKGSNTPVPVRLRVTGAHGEYLTPFNRTRLINSRWFEDYGPDYLPPGGPSYTYIDGRTEIKLPLGKVHIEVSKGFEIKPLTQTFTITPRTRTLRLELDRVLPWRKRGWLSADTHVHFLSPATAHLEGAAEGVNVVNLLAAQWGELMTNVADFDGKSTFGSRESGGQGEHLVRVGTENRQHVLGHISLIGYKGPMINPLSAGGPDEAALGDPVDILLTGWARQCRAQGGLVVLPHFPQPRSEHAAVLVKGLADGVEMTSWGNVDMGVDPYALSDWYRYLNCGYHVPCVAGTDKMTANTAVGTVRVYTRLPNNRPWDYELWMRCMRAGETFVTYGPLVEFSVEGRPAGSRVKLKQAGGTLQVRWKAESVVRPMTRVDLVLNGEIIRSESIEPWKAEGTWEIPVRSGCWMALLVRGGQILDPKAPDLIAAHSSAVMVDVEGHPLFSRMDAVTILEQIEGSLAYIDTIGTRAETQTYKAMRLELKSAHRLLHQRLHVLGKDHPHHGPNRHAEHRR